MENISSPKANRKENEAIFINIKKYSNVNQKKR